MGFKDIYEFGVINSRYESLLREELEKDSLIYKTYC